MTAMEAGGRKCPISIVLAVAVRLYREGLVTALRSDPRLRIDAGIGTLVEARSAVLATDPDLLIVDVSLEGVCDAIREFRRQGSRCRILALAVREDITAILDYAQAGADGFVASNGSMAELIEAIERTTSGELLCSPRIAAQLLQHAAHRSAGVHEPGTSLLTGREQQVLALLRRGMSNKEIGGALHIAEATAKNHVHHVLAKLQVNTRSKAAASLGFPARPAPAPPAPSRNTHRAAEHA
jgi:DNA-binding NarL/FixJ family response regulator